MNDFDISAGRSSTRLHAAPGGRSTFSLAHDSGNDGKTPKELAALRKLANQAEADRQYLTSTQAIQSNGSQKAVENTGSKLFGGLDAKPSAGKVDLFKSSAPFALADDLTARSSTRVIAAPGGRQTLVLGDHAADWGRRDDAFSKPKPTPRAHVVSDMSSGSQMASLFDGGVLGESNVRAVAPPISNVFGTKAPLDLDDSRPDTSNMSHKERIAAMKAYRSGLENAGAGAVPALTKQLTAGHTDGLTHTSECSIGDRPSSRVLAPPGGRSTFVMG